MRDTTCSVLDAASRGRECAAPTLSNGNQSNVTSVSGSPLRDYLVDQLVIAATWLTESHIFRKDPELPLCQLCLMTGHNGRAIPHLSSCLVGRVLRAIGDLTREPEPQFFDGVAQRTESATSNSRDAGSNPAAISTPDECPMCGPDCVGGAHRNALREDGIRTREQYEALKNPAALAAMELA